MDAYTSVWQENRQICVGGETQEEREKDGSHFASPVNFYAITKTPCQTIETIASFQETYQEIDNLSRIFWKLKRIKKRANNFDKSWPEF